MTEPPNPVRKRPLSELHTNIPPPVSEKRRHSSIDMISERKSSTLAVSKSNRPSSIPAAPVKPRAHETAVDAKNCLGIKNRLKASTTVRPEHEPPQHQSFAATPPASVDLHSLETQVSQLAEKIEDLRDEIDAIVREQAKLRHRIADGNYSAICNTRTLEREVETLQKEQEHMEQLLKVQLQELEVKLDDDFNELKFNLQSEIKSAENYQDEDLLKDIEHLAQAGNQLQLQLEQIKETNQKKITEESNSLKQELDTYVTAQEEETDKLSSLFDVKEKQLRQVYDRLSSLQADINSRTEENEEAASRIARRESKMGDYPVMKSNLLKALAGIENTLKDASETSMIWQDKLILAEKAHSVASTRQNKFDVQRRILENSIMDYENKMRVYLKINSDSQTHLSNSFNKVFTKENNYESISHEFSCLIKQCVAGTNVSIIHTGLNKSHTIVDLIRSSHRFLSENCEQLIDWKFEFTFKCITISSEDRVFDLLNSFNEIRLEGNINNSQQIPSQGMIIDDPGQFMRILTQLDRHTDSLNLFAIKVKGSKETKTVESDIFFFDMSAVAIPLQAGHLHSFPASSSYTNLSKVFGFAYLHSKCLFMSNVNDVVNEANVSLIHELERINTIDSPYGKK